MRVTKWYCDVCKKEIHGDPETRLIHVPTAVGQHGLQDRTISIVDTNGNKCLDFCEDCKGTIAVLFGGKSNG